MDDHSFFFTHTPDSFTQPLGRLGALSLSKRLGEALHFYGIALRDAPTPQAKGKIERRHDSWQKRLPPLLAADQILALEPANALLDQLLFPFDPFGRLRAFGPWWRFVWSLRTPIRVGDDGRAPVRNLRLSVDAPARSRLIHCLLPDGDIFLLKSPPTKNSLPLILLHSPVF